MPDSCAKAFLPTIQKTISRLNKVYVSKLAGPGRKSKKSSPQDAEGGAPFEKKPRPKDVPGSYVLSVGRFVEAKGFERLIQSWVDRSETLLIAGDGPDFDNMNAMVSELGLAEKVKLLGFRDDIQALMQNCDALVISSFREGFPYVIVEALHAKCKIMSTTIPGAEDFLPADALVDKESFNTFNAALDYCLSESSAKAFQQSWAKASKYLTLEAMTSETVMVYKKCKPQPTL